MESEAQPYPLLEIKDPFATLSARVVPQGKDVARLYLALWGRSCQAGRVRGTARAKVVVDRLAGWLEGCSQVRLPRGFSAVALAASVSSAERQGRLH